jgi:lipoyl(octanoyl) transferase
LKVLNWGLIPYTQSLAQQEQLVEEIALAGSPGCLIQCTHPPVVTLGRKTQPGDVFGWTGEIVEISRGGRATYHGPNQLVIYPIVNLAIPGAQRRAKDILQLIRLIEKAISRSLSHYGLQAETPAIEEKNLEVTGVWIHGKKVASIGIAVRKWISFHGLAVNLERDPLAFRGLKPCGFSQNTMSSIEDVLNKKLDRTEYGQVLTEALISELF